MINIFELVLRYKKVQGSVLQTFAYGYVWIKVVLTYISMLNFNLFYLEVELSNSFCGKVEIKTHSFKQIKLFRFTATFLGIYLISCKKLDKKKSLVSFIVYKNLNF